MLEGATSACIRQLVTVESRGTYEGLVQAELVLTTERAAFPSCAVMLGMDYCLHTCRSTVIPYTYCKQYTVISGRH